MLTATDISLLFLGVLIVMVLLEVRKISRRSQPAARLEEQVERLSQQVARISPSDMVLPGGAQLVATGRRFETVSEQLERLGESTDELRSSLVTEEGVRRFADGLDRIRADLAAARSLYEETVQGLVEASDSLAEAGSALQRIEARLRDVLVPSAGAVNGD